MQYIFPLRGTAAVYIFVMKLIADFVYFKLHLKSIFNAIYAFFIGKVGKLEIFLICNSLKGKVIILILIII